MTSGESSNEDVDAFVVTGKHDFKTSVLADSDLSYVVQWMGDINEEISCIVDYWWVCENCRRIFSRSC